MKLPTRRYFVGTAPVDPGSNTGTDAPLFYSQHYSVREGDGSVFNWTGSTNDLTALAILSNRDTVFGTRSLG